MNQSLKPKNEFISLKWFKEYCHEIKMNNNTVKQLKAIAKERDIKGYYKLIKAELISALEATRLVEQKSSIFDEPIPNDPTPVLQPTRWRSSNFVEKSKQNIKTFAGKNMQNTKQFFTKGMQKIKDFGEWLLNYIPPKPKVVDKMLESFKNKIKKLYNKRDTSFQLKESKSALKKFAIQYRIDGKDWIDPDLFVVNAKQSIAYFLINRQQIEVKLIVSCMIEKVDLKVVK